MVLESYVKIQGMVSQKIQEPLTLVANVFKVLGVKGAGLIKWSDGKNSDHVLIVELVDPWLVRYICYEYCAQYDGLKIF